MRHVPKQNDRTSPRTPPGGGLLRSTGTARRNFLAPVMVTLALFYLPQFLEFDRRRGAVIDAAQAHVALANFHYAFSNGAHSTHRLALAALLAPPGNRFMVGELCEPKPIPVGQEPPPMHRSPGDNGRPPARHQGHGDKAKGKPARRKTGDRFAVVNAFVDFTLAGLTRNEIAAWLVLWRDTKPTARRGLRKRTWHAGPALATARYAGRSPSWRGGGC